jgi:hypothetical protein
MCDCDKAHAAKSGEGVSDCDMERIKTTASGVAIGFTLGSVLGAMLVAADIATTGGMITLVCAAAGGAAGLNAANNSKACKESR